MFGWVLLVWAASAAAFLCLRPLFRPWPDQGYALARVAGPLLVGLGAWLLAGLAPLPLTRATAAAALGALIGAAILVTWRHRHVALPPGRLLLTIDLVWLACVAAFGVVRAWSPSIGGAERPMDHALLAAMLGQQAVLPVDPWLAGYVVNYHVAGHAWWAPFAALLRLPPWIAYNLIAITLPAQVLVGAWAVGQRLHAAWAWMGAAALVGAGSWSALDVAMRQNRLPTAFEVTRVVPGTINEFPFFSLTWGDLHAHVLAMPLLVLLVGLLLRVDEQARERRPLVEMAGLTALTTAVGVAAVMTSTWDAAPVGLAVFCAGAIVARRNPQVVVPLAVVAAAVALTLAWPMARTFRPPPVTRGFEWLGSPLGPFLLAVGTWLTPVLLVAATQRWTGAAVAAVGAGGALMWTLPDWRVRILLILVAAGLWRRRAALGRPGTALALAGLGLLVLAESVWLDDVYGWELRRLNTVFKWHLHAIVLLSLGLPAAMHTLWADPRLRVRRVVRATLVLLVASGTAGTVSVLAARWQEREPTPGFDGRAAMARRWPGDARVVTYLWTHAAPSDIVLEAPGRSYTYGSRISVMTGRPTLIGWEGHERLWRRGEHWRSIIDHRVTDVDALYAGPPDNLHARLRASGVRYVVVGPVERQRYSGLSASRFAQVADVVMEDEGTVLLRVR